MRKILVVEDNEMNREILKDILCDAYDILEAENGAVGLKLLEDHYKDISVVLLDLQMPVMDGFAFLEHVHGDTLLSAVPVIVMTADENGDTEERCMQYGAVEFLEKPYNPVVMLGRIRNMIRMREAAADMRSIEYDDVTDLYTRQAFYHYADKLLREDTTTDYSLLISDIREFKLINDVYGEAAGDRVLRAIADKFRADVRVHGGVAGRYGADRFAVLLASEKVPSVSSMEESLKAHTSIASVDPVRLKLGIYEHVDRNLSIMLICDRAISALDIVKTSYDRNVGTYDGPLAQKKRQEQQTEAAFFPALERGEFEPWFQPKVDPVSGRIVGAEALVRWRRPDGSMMAPYLFIPVYEKDGLIVHLDEFMFRRVCELQRRWMDEGKPAVPISVNMSRITLLRSGTTELYRKIAEEAGAPLAMVPIEVTESAAFLSSQISERMKQLKTVCFSLDMDDFGSGYSSLTSLGVLPFDVIKLDKSLTDTITAPRGEMIVGHMLEVIRALGMHSVVEGVETAEQVEILKRLGCDAIQGYYYSKPVPREAYERMLTEGLPG